MDDKNLKIGSIGFTRDPDVAKATERMNAALEAVRQFLVTHPDVFLVGPDTEDTTFVFGARDAIFEGLRVRAG